MGRVEENFRTNPKIWIGWIDKPTQPKIVSQPNPLFSGLDRRIWIDAIRWRVGSSKQNFDVTKPNFSATSMWESLDSCLYATLNDVTTRAMLMIEVAKTLRSIRYHALFFL